MAFILGRKIGMTQIYKEDGTVVPVTVIDAGPMTVVQIKNEEVDGYDAIQFGSGNAKKMLMPQRGHAKASKSEPKVLRELRIEDASEDMKNLKVGDKMDISAFAEGDKVKISGISKGKGFQGVVKRHNFAGAPASHGHKSVLRHGGSTGQRFPQHTLKGLRMAGRMGNVNRSVRGLEVIAVNKEEDTLAVKGAVPGRKGTLLVIRSI
ncbi:MAG: 50S ribosomal protein L3 [Parcubacteria group bacterium]